jgi:hypothetical protein
LNGAEHVLRGADRGRSRLRAAYVLSPAGDRGGTRRRPSDAGASAQVVDVTVRFAFAQASRQERTGADAVEDDAY